MFGQILSRGRAVVDLFAMLVSHAYIARRSRSTVARFINEESSTARLVVGFSRSRSIRGGGIYIYIYLFSRSNISVFYFHLVITIHRNQGVARILISYA